MHGVSAGPDGRSLPALGDLIADRYRIERVLGRGGMGVAYAATNVVTGKKLALKWILREGNATRLQRVIREARAAGRIQHPNIVDVYDVGEHDGTLFLVMELLHGQSLQALLDERGRLAPNELLGWLLPALRGIRKAHRCGVIHRDIKPANVFLSCDEAGEPLTAKVLDFGVSKIIASEAGMDDPSLTDSGAVVGTPSYTAPEQLERADRADRRADIYACGALLYHALSGRRPFEAESYAQLVVKIMTTQPVPLAQLRPELPRALCEVIARAMQRDPEQRFADMDGLIDALAGHAPQSLVPQAGESRATATRRGFGAYAGTLGLVALVLALAGAALSLGNQGSVVAAETPNPGALAAMSETAPAPRGVASNDTATSSESELTRAPTQARAAELAVQTAVTPKRSAREHRSLQPRAPAAMPRPPAPVSESRESPTSDRETLPSKSEAIIELSAEDF